MTIGLEISHDSHFLCASSIGLDLPSSSSFEEQREELQDLIKEAKNKEECDQSGSFIYRVRGPPLEWYLKKIAKSSEESKAQRKKR